MTFLLLMTIVSARGNTINITRIYNNPGIYFEELGKVELYSSEWKVVVYYDLKSLQEAETIVNKYVVTASELCKTQKSNPFLNVTCSNVIKEINQIAHDTEQKLNLLTHGSRSKRALFDAIGVVSKALFGTLNSDDAKYYDQQIEKLRNDEGHLLSLIKEQTVLIETTDRTFNKTQEMWEEQMNELDNKFSLIKNQIEEFKNQSLAFGMVMQIGSLISAISLMTLRYQGVINAVMDLVTDVRHGKPNPSLITPDQLEDILTTIQKKLPRDAKLPASIEDTNLLALYRIGHTSATTVNSKIIYELRIPLPSKENYQLFKVIPLPTPHNQSLIYVQPTIEYLVIDYNREHYYDMTYKEMASCTTEDHDYFLCRILHPIFAVDPDTKSCELRLLKRQIEILSSCILKQSDHDTVWIQLSQVNKWIISSLRKITADYICDEIIIPQEIIGVSILEISGNCYLRTPELTIRGYTTKASQLKNSYVPPLNLTNIINTISITNVPDIKTNKVRLIKYSPQGDLVMLSEKIKNLKNQENKELSKLDSHTIHHYTIVYIIVLIILVYGVYQMYYKCMHKKENSTKNETEEKCDNPMILTLG